MEEKRIDETHVIGIHVSEHLKNTLNAHIGGIRVNESTFEVYQMRAFFFAKFSTMH